MPTQNLELNELLQAGAHFGHQTHKWNPRMRPYVYGERNGIYIMDLTKTIELANKAYQFLKSVTASGKSVLFVATKRQASEVVKQAAIDSDSFFVTHRWLGGMLTNYKTISLSIDKLRKVEKMKANGDFFLLTKKEQSRIEKSVGKLEKNLGGIKDMRKLPGALVVIDPNSEKIAINEAKCLGIPIVGLVDTNCDPTGIDYVVPGNDDAIKSITIFTHYFANAINEGAQKAKGKSKSDAPDRNFSLEKEILKKFEKDVELNAPALEAETDI